jgi:hypothetical protein
MIRFPGGRPAGRVRGLVGHLDIVPTILDAMGVEPAPSLRGRSLLDVLADPGRHDPPAYLLEHWNGTSGMRLGPWMVLAHRRSTSIARLSGQKVWYQDPGRHLVLWTYLRERLALMLLDNRVEQQASGADVDASTQAQLEALGYIMDGEDAIAGE